ncbi:ankyrin [Hypoxylon cercidicola]|nr:ankyrin [Hypoxylon cercidicola]
MATKTRKIPQTLWDKHKDTILNLYLDNDLSMEKLIETMNHDHGFTATISQFEAQLRVWKARKNLRVHEWEKVLETIDSLASRGVKSRVLVSDHIVPMNKVRRARRHCQANARLGKRRRVEEDSHDDAANNGSASDVVIEIQDSSGQWSQYTTPVDGDIAPNHHQTCSITQEQGNYVPSPRLQSFTPGLISDSWLTTDVNEGVQSMDFSLVEYEIQEVPQPFVQYGPYVDNTGLYADNIFPGLELAISPSHLTDLLPYPPATSHLNDLPFEQFERDLKLKRLQLAAFPSPTQEFGLLPGVQRLAFMFATDAATIMTQVNGKPFRENLEHAGIQLQTLHSILPRSQKGGPLQMTEEVELHRLLLYSSANGFMGLGGVPIETVFRFLSQKSNATSLLSRLFQHNPGHIGTSLAENLFHAAIESGDHNATRFFLQTGLVNVYKTFFIVNGEKYTPLERAAELQGLKVVKELLRFKPEVNKTFFNRPVFIPIEGVLGFLIIGICPKDETKRNHSPFALEYLEVVELLIEAGAEIHASSICGALRRFARMDLAKKLLCRLPPSDHCKALYGLPSNCQLIAEEFTDEEATEAMAKILSDCEQTKCKRCLSLYSDELNDSIVMGAKRGHIKLVRSLFQHAKSPTEILSAAIRGGNHELVEFVLAQRPDISRAPAAPIAAGEYTTPLAEAIDAGDSALIKRLENEGALENLDGHRFVPAIAAASKVGNIDYARKLLLHHPKFHAKEIKKALLEAIKHRRERIVKLFLDVGAQLDYFSDTNLIIEAYKWGSQTVLDDLMSTFPDFDISYSSRYVRLLESAVSDMGEFLQRFHQSGRLDRDCLTSCLQITVSRGDGEMLNYLLELGADPMNNSVLVNAVDGHNDMLRILLEHIPPTKMPIRSFGTRAVRKAIGQNPSNIEALELLLACSAVDFKLPIVNYYPGQIQQSEQSSPLGSAIQRDVTSGCSDFPLTRRLLDVGCDVDQIVNIRWADNGLRVNKTSILIAIQTKSKSIVQFLLSRGADVNKEAIHGIKRTPLQAAAEQGSLDLVELLLQHGANVNGKPAEYRGATALQCAAMSGNCNIAALLLENGALLYNSSSTFDGRSPIQGAAEHGRVDMIQFLWNASLGVGFPTEECRRAMELAEENGHMACRNLILELAVMSGNIPMVEMSE